LSNLHQPLRSELKDQTNDAHRRVDALYSSLDLGCGSGCSVFLRAHLLALQTLEARVHRGAVPGSVASQFPKTSTLADSDLRALGGLFFSRKAVECAEHAHPLGIIYVVCGAHFGSRVLSSMWMRSTDPLVLQASTYIRGQQMHAYWPHVLSALDAESVANFQSIVLGAQAAFGVFEAAFHTAIDYASGGSVS
jgi:heme oxygenase (biliverdin-IX-beta and delta-forming)